MRTFRFTVCALSVVLVAGFSFADTIDFEGVGNSMGEGAFLASVQPGGSPVTATFSVVGSGIPAGSIPRIVKYGPSPTFGFTNTVNGNDTPDLSSPLLPRGEYFITNGSSSPKNMGDYRITFDQPVRAVSLLLYDYRADGNTQNGRPGIDSVDLVGSLNGVLASTDSYTVPDPISVTNDGNIVKLQLPQSTVVNELLVRFDGSDLGTGIDQITFTPIPEPVAFSGLVGLLALAGILRRRVN